MVILKTMIAKTKTIQSMSYAMRKTERIGNEMIEQNSFIKWARSPFQVYIKQLQPNKGLEVVYIENENNNKAQINPNGFPWVSINLSPFHSKMRKNQHHTLYESGFDYFISILEHMIEKYGAAMDSMLSVKGQVHWKNRKCWELEIINPNFKYVSYTVNAKEESLLTIAKEHKVSEYMILEANKSIKSYTDIATGQTIRIPNDYSSKITLYIDQETMTPSVIHVEDDRGMFERYELTDLMVFDDKLNNEIAFK
jgi:outer membrane lipoprotein-sorting protein